MWWKKTHEGGKRPDAEKGERVCGAQGASSAGGAEELLSSLLYYRKSLSASIRCNLWLSGVSLLCVGVAAAAALFRPEPVYFGMNQEMKLLPMTPLASPVMGEAALKNWVSEALSEAFNIDYLNWREQLSRSRVHFTKDAFTKFAVSLDEEGHLPLLRQQRAIMHSVIQGTPLLTKSGVVNGRLSWEFDVPMLVSYETSRGRVSNNQISVVCRVERVAASEHPKGVAISGVVTRQRQAASR